MIIDLNDEDLQAIKLGLQEVPIKVGLNTLVKIQNAINAGQQRVQMAEVTDVE